MSKVPGPLPQPVDVTWVATSHEGRPCTPVIKSKIKICSTSLEQEKYAKICQI